MKHKPKKSVSNFLNLVAVVGFERTKGGNYINLGKCASMIAPKQTMQAPSYESGENPISSTPNWAQTMENSPFIS